MNLSNITTSDCRGVGSDPNLPFAQAIAFCCLHGVSALTNVIGNLLVLTAIRKNRRLQTFSNIFIASLAFADFLTGLITGPLYIAIASLRLWASDHILYRIENFIRIQSLAATSFSLCAVSVDRYLAVTSAVRYRTIISARKCLTAVYVIWLLSVLIASSSFLVHTNKEKGQLFFFIEVRVNLAYKPLCKQHHDNHNYRPTQPASSSPALPHTRSVQTTLLYANQLWQYQKCRTIKDFCRPY